MMLEMKLPEKVRFIIDRIESHGYQANVVGGPVRDFLLGIDPTDFDITTSASPEEVKRIFADFRTIDTGIKHGTVTLVLEKENFEITTYRIDGEYKDSRHPESVIFTDDLSLDLSRRDFTMNAIAYNPYRGFTDRYNGEEDIANGTIRAVGDPYKRFEEDALRILRGIRFASTFGFRLEEKTKRASVSLAHLLRQVSAERVFVEWKKLVGGKFVYEVILEYKDIIKEFLPEIAGASLPDRTRFEAAEPFVRMVSLFANSGDEKGRKYCEAMQRLRTDSFTRDVGALMLGISGKFDTGSVYGIKKLMSSYGVQVTRLALQLEILLGIRESESIVLLEKIISAKEPYRISDLDVNGNDLRDLGYRGAEIGNKLSQLLDMVMCGEISNSRKALIAEAEKTAPAPLEEPPKTSAIKRCTGKFGF